MSVLAKAGALLLAGLYVDAKTDVVSDLGKVGILRSLQSHLDGNSAADRNSVFYIFEQTARARGDAECYVFERESMSWREVDLAARKVAHYLVSQGARSGQVIALLMGNKLAYPIIWLACLSLNVIPAFINTALVGASLTHCVAVSNAELFLYDSDLAAPVRDALPLLRKSLPNLSFVQWHDSSCLLPLELMAGAQLLTKEKLAEMSGDRIGDEWRKGITWQDSALLIFTSGTTGLPKAANCTHGRIATAFVGWSKMNRFGPSTRIFTPMPLYHSTAALLALGVSWYAGSTVIIGRKFSATTFWDECRAANVNTVQYVGEVLRYLLAVPPSPMDKQHNVRLAYGNGCRPDVWNKFRDRFGVGVISEFFASTEGNGTLLNYNRNNFGSGAVGQEGKLAGWVRRFDQAILRVDPLTEEPERDAKGFCIRAAPDEDGELVCIIKKDSAYQAFAGYRGNDSATSKKILEHVFKADDLYFRTGDLLRRSKDGFYYFSDRLGDTFRWKSENVATTEVQLVLGEITEAANVYGVLVPGHEGRAGCAAILNTSGRPIDLQAIATQVIKSLPKYAQPLFIRVVEKLESTGTQKQVKTTLRTEGVDPALVKGDPLYWLQNGVYKQFTARDWVSLQNGRVKL